MNNAQPDHKDPAEHLPHPPDLTEPFATADTEGLYATSPAPKGEEPASAQTQPLPGFRSHPSADESDYQHPAAAAGTVPVWSARDTQPEVSRTVRPWMLTWALVVIAAGVGLAFAAAGYRPNLQFSFVGVLAFVGAAFVVAALVSLLPKKKQR